jgi:Rad3-related DNA helicase
LCRAPGLQAYGVQLGFMSKVLQALGSQENALLEAPTGSGKTLSLLCAALSWQRKLKADGCVQRCATPFLSSLTLVSYEGAGTDAVAAHLDV